MSFTPDTVVLTTTDRGVRIDGPGFTIGDTLDARAKITQDGLVQLIDGWASDLNNRDIFRSRGTHYTKFRTSDGNSFASAQEVVDHITGFTEVDDAVRDVGSERNDNFTTSFGRVEILDNSANAVNVTLPKINAYDVGKDIIMVIKEAPGTNTVRVWAANTAQTINGVPASGSDVAKAVYNTGNKTFTILTLIAISETAWMIQQPDATVTTDGTIVWALGARRKKPNEATVNPDSYERFKHTLSGAVGGNFLTDNGNWTIAIQFANGVNISSAAEVPLVGSEDVTLVVGKDGRTFGVTPKDLDAASVTYAQTLFNGRTSTPQVSEQKLANWVIATYDGGYINIWIDGALKYYYGSIPYGNANLLPSDVPQTLELFSIQGVDSRPAGTGIVSYESWDGQQSLEFQYSIPARVKQVFLMNSTRITQSQANELRDGTAPESSTFSASITNHWRAGNGSWTRLTGTVDLNPGPNADLEAFPE